jgi:hypothetical protein
MSQTTQTESYALYVTYYYFSGTFNVPRDGLMTQDYDGLLTFPSAEAAYSWLRDNNMSPCNADRSEWSMDGRYVCAHGEYERPTYHVRRKTGSGWRRPAATR